MVKKPATKKQDVRTSARKLVGREAADAIMLKIDKMLEKGATAIDIEKMVREEHTKWMKKSIAYFLILVRVRSKV